MSIKMAVAKQVIDEKIIEGATFSLEDIEKEAKIQGGGEMVAPRVSILDYVECLEGIDLVKYNQHDDNYIVFNGKLEEKLEKLEKVKKLFILPDKIE